MDKGLRRLLESAHGRGGRDCGGLAIAAGLLFGLFGTVKRRISMSTFATSIILAFLTAGVISLTLHGEPRDLVPAYPWLWIAAASGLGFLASSRNRTTAFAIDVFVLAVG